MIKQQHNRIREEWCVERGGGRGDRTEENGTEQNRRGLFGWLID